MRAAPQPRSLQLRLLALVLGTVTLVWLVAASVSWYDTRHELDELLDGHLAQAAALLVAQQAGEGSDDGVADAPALHKYAPRVAFQVFHEGRLVMRSSNAQIAPMSAPGSGFVSLRLSDGKDWRVFATHGARSDVQVYVGEQTAARRDILRAILRSVFLPLLFALPLLALVVWWAVQQGLLPLRQLGAALRQRPAQALDRLALTDIPAEIQTLVQALNELFERIAGMLDAERRFTADAAHELRTPIAAIRAQAQVALAAVSDSGQREHALQATLAGCDRATRLIEQLLTLARLEAAPVASAATLDLSALVRGVAAGLAPQALARHQTLELDAPQPCVITGNEMLASVLVRNLIDNAMRYSPEGAQVRLRVGSEQGRAVLHVDDSGPGMAEPDIARLGKRFFRVLGNDQPGSGLGWSIVKRIAAVLGAQVTASRSATLGGLAVSVHWPLQELSSAIKTVAATARV